MERERDEAMLLASLLAMSSLGVIHVGRKLDSFNLLVGGRILVLDFDVSHILEGSEQKPPCFVASCGAGFATRMYWQVFFQKDERTQ